MALSQKHRVALYEHFLPRLGDDVTEALLAEFPARDGDELVTKEFLRAELAELSVSMNHRMTTLFVATIATQLTALGLATTVILAVQA